MIRVESVSVTYGGPDVVKSLSFEVANNHNLCILGPNGCGKTTLLKAMANLMPFRGKIELDGISVKAMKQNDLSKKIAMMTQNTTIYFSYTVFETVMMGRYVYRDGIFGVSSKKDTEYVLECLDCVSLLAEKDREISKLSGGQLQRVFLARTLAQQPDIILLDEPTNHLDLKHQIELIDYLKKWSTQGSNTVVGVLHDINLAMRLSENIMLMKDGEIMAIGSAKQVVTGELLKQTYDADVAGYMKESLKVWEKI